MLRPDQIADTYPLTPLQEGMLFHEREGSSGVAYFEQFAFTLEGELDYNLFVASWNEVIRRHPALRTVFAFQKAARPMQLVLKEWEARPEVLDWSEKASTDLTAALERLKREDRERPFALNREPPSRWTFITLPDRKTLIIWSHHHIILDGWSGGIVLREVLDVYKNKRAGRVSEWNAPPSFKSFIECLENDTAAAALAHWDRAFSGLDEIPQLPRTTNESASSGYVQRTWGFNLRREETQALEALAVEFDMTLGGLTQLLWGLVAARCCGSLSTAYLTIVSGRSPRIPGVEDSVGLFINPAPVVVRAEPGETLRDFAERGYDAWLDSEPFHHISLSEIQGHLGRNRNFDHLLVFVNYPMEKMLSEFNDPTLGFRLVEVDVFEHSNYGLELIVHPGETVRFDFKYNAASYSQEIVSGLAEALQTVLKQACTRPSARVEDLELLSPEARSRVLELGAARAVDERVPSVVRRFRAKVKQFPQRTALISEGKETSYQDLGRAVDQIARALQRDHGISVGDRVGICMQSGFDLVRGILGVLSVGGTYVPLDPDYPAERLQWMIQDSGMGLVLADTELEPLCRGAGATTCRLDSLLGVNADAGGIQLGGLDVKPSDAAYVIYTSGSTGRPKGCVVSHDNLARLFDHDPFLFDFDETDVWIVAHSFCFDFSVWEMYGALLFGGALLLPPKNANQNPGKMVSLVRQYGVTVLNQTPGAFLQFAQAHLEVAASAPLSSLRWVIFGGDRLEPSRLSEWAKRYPLEQVRLVNMYGITETTVHVTFHQVTRTDLEPGHGGRSPVGLPLPHMETYLCDPCQKLVPPGIPGEFYVGGDGVSLGYLNREDLTRERFLSSPFHGGKRLYRTGDLGLWNREGRLEYIGRNDAQAQIRGFRVEMGEVESRVLEVPGVRGAVVVPVKTASGGDEAIAAYVVLESSENVASEFSGENARCFLAERMPRYMIPSYFIVVSAFPLNRNGKVDRAALPDPRTQAVASEAESRPRTEEEQVIAKIWAEALERSDVGIVDNFFELGGHSLVATRIASRIFKQTGVAVPLRLFFEEATVATIAREVARLKPVPEEPLESVSVQDSYPLSNAQRRLWVADQMKGGDAAYNLATRYRLRGALDPDALARSFSWVVDRHESLRTKIKMIDGEPRQVIAPSGHFSLALEQNLTSGQAEQKIDALGSKPFHLDGGDLIRATLYRVAADEWLLGICLHHIITDGWSLSQMAYEVGQAYEAFVQGTDPSLSELTVQYKDYSDWQRRTLESGALTGSRDYWHKRFELEPEPLDLSCDWPRPAEKTFVGQNVQFELSTSQLNALRALAERNGATLFMALTAVVKVLLSRLTGRSDIVIGSPVAGRTRAELTEQLGCYLNTLALRTQIDGQGSFRDVLSAVRTTVTEAFDHQAYPFDVLVDELKLNRDTSRAPLFDVLLGLQSQSVVQLTLPGVEVNEEPVSTHSSKFDLTWSFEELESRLQVNIEINTDLWDEGRASEFFHQFESIVEFVTQSPNESLTKFSLVSEPKRRQIEREWNPVDTPYPDDQDLASLFERCVAKYATSVAVWDAGECITYRELDLRANRIAAGLRRGFDVRSGSHVGLCVSRGVDAVASVLAILKLGATYVPIDTSFPVERAYILARDADCQVIICDAKQAARLSEGDVERDGIQSACLEAVRIEEVTDFDPESRDANQLAYIMYTSGSTGNPKGVAVQHRSVARLVCETNYVQVAPDDRILQLSNIAFDGSVFDIFGALLNGATLVLVDEDSARDLTRLRGLVRESGANVSFVTTALFNQLVDFDLELLSSFRILLFGGQDASVEHVRRASQPGTGPRELVHVYGPTEATTFATFYPVLSIPKRARRIPIGRPVSNTSAYVLDEHLNLQPPGVPGDLYLGGPGLAREYWGQADATQARFIANPFRRGERLYLTGDRVLWNRDGQIEFLGRRDGQVKIRGYRIELGEIENALLGHGDVQRAAVVARSKMADGTKEIVAYVVPSEPGSLAIDDLRRTLSRCLPDYMLPSFFVEMDDLLMTPNGKIDTRALPEPEGRSLGGGEAQVAARNEQEVALLSLTQEILHQPEMGVRDNYFSMGGDSIKAIQIASRLHERGYRLEVKDIFLHQTVEELAMVIARVEHADAEESVEGSAPLGPAQQWYFDTAREQAASLHFNQSVRLRLRDRVSPKRVREALNKLVRHHDALRCRFGLNEQGGIEQQYASDDSSVWFETIDLSDGTSNESDSRCRKALEELQTSMNPAAGCLLGGLLIQGAESDELVVSVHHLAVDTVSWQILAEDFDTLLSGDQDGDSGGLPAKTASYSRWATLLREALADRGQMMAEEESFWRKHLPGEVPAFFSSRSAVDAGLVGDEVTIREQLSIESTRGLASHAAVRPGIGMMAMLLTAISIARSRHGEYSPLICALEGHGRDLSFVGELEVSRTVGWFTDIYPISVPPTTDCDLGFDKALSQIGDMLMAVKRREVPFVLTGVGRAAKFALSVNYLGEVSGASAGQFLKKVDGQLGPLADRRLRRFHEVDLVAEIDDGRLTLTLSFSRAQYVASFLATYLKSVVAVLESVAAREQLAWNDNETGSSEFDVDFSDDELDSLLGGVGIDESL